jgi:hypothetical protein
MHDLFPADVVANLVGDERLLVEGGGAKIPVRDQSDPSSLNHACLL